MTIHRIQVNSWHNHGWLKLHNGCATRRVIQYMPQYELGDSVLVRKLARQKNCDRGMDDLAKVALVAGPYATLWVGDLEGKIVPPDVEPEGWTYANGEPVEPSWFWQWIPSDAADKALTEDLFDTNPLKGEPKYFKSLVPYGVQRGYSEVTQIEGIDLTRLVGMVRGDLPWIFEFEVGE